jgi:hypothetical protein
VEGDDNNAIIAFCFGFAATSLLFFLFCCNTEGDNRITITFYFGLATAKKAMTM